MAVSAHDVAAAIRERLPGIDKLKLHKLLYYCQGHHLAHFGVPLFRERISAWDHGPVVGALWKQERQREVPAERAVMDEGELNTVAYVVSRYGRLTGRELELMTHGETPWRLADANRLPTTSTRIDVDVIRDYFVQADIADRDEDPVFDSAQVSAMLAGAEERRSQPGTRLSVEEMWSRLAELSAARG
jgi:uncharacterized phage-associated protein